MEELLDLALQRINDLEKRLEIYYKMLRIENEIDFVLKGTYILPEDMENIINGNY